MGQLQVSIRTLICPGPSPAAIETATPVATQLVCVKRALRRTEMFIIWWIIVGLIAGFITGKLMKGSGFGTIGDIVVGIIGAIIGGFIMRTLGFAGQGGLLYTILVAVVGAVILTLLLRLVTGNKSRNL
jgi:uncharacterized membrane protein YeaQ/YmgE (transglycosylase-associated protein family)